MMVSGCAATALPRTPVSETRATLFHATAISCHSSGQFRYELTSKHLVEFLSTWHEVRRTSNDQWVTGDSIERTGGVSVRSELDGGSKSVVRRD